LDEDADFPTLPAFPSSSSPSVAPSVRSSPRPASYSRPRKTDPVEESLIELIKEKPDEDKLFLMSLLPDLKKLPDELKATAKMRFQMILFELNYHNLPNLNSAQPTYPYPYYPQ
jgi:hypothetical protein